MKEITKETPAIVEIESACEGLFDKAVGEVENGIASLVDIESRIQGTDVLLFDMDDTLIETGYANYMAYKNAIELSLKSKIHIPFRPETRFNRGSMTDLFPALSQSELEEIIAIKNKLYLYYLPHTSLSPLVAYALNTYRHTNTVVLVTNSREERALQTLEYHKLLHLFDFKFYKPETSGRGPEGKFAKAIFEMGVSPANAFVIENEKSERDAAQRAGIPQRNIKTL